MAGPIRRYGRPVSGPEIDIGFIGSGMQRACVYDAHPDTLIVYALRGWLGEWSGGTPYGRIFMGDVDSNGNPGTRLAYTSEFNPSAVYSDITGGGNYGGNVTPFIHTSKAFVLGYTSRNGNIAHSMREAAAISASNRNFYDRSISGNVPTNPIGGTPAYNGHMSLWFEAEENVAPGAPSNVTITNSLVPTIAATFNDANKTLNNGAAWDQAYQCQIRVLQGSTVKMDVTYTTNSTERSNHRTSRSYSGSALLYNTTYTVQIRHRDRAGLWGPYFTGTFSITPPNTKPNTPTNLTPTGSNASASLTPTLTSNFSDPDEVLSTGQTWDYLNQYQIRVTRVSDGATMWAPSAFNASTAERNNKATSRTYAGTALAFNTTYKYEIRHSDRVGAWSNWANTTFSITSLATIETPSAPSGFQTANPPPNIVAKYTHQSGLSANRVQARLLSASGSVITTGPEVAKTVAANANISLTWAEAGLGTLQYGGSYQVQVRARDTNNIWSPSWSPARSFWINTPPLVPTNLTPDNGAASPNRPVLQAVSSDPDEEQGYPTVYAEIMNSGGTVLQTRTMTHMGSGVYEYQTVSGDLASHATYKWRAYSKDAADLYSGGATTAAGATRSAEATFVYAEVPSVEWAIPGPETVSSLTTALPITTSFSGGGTFSMIRMRGYDHTDGRLVLDTGQITEPTLLFVPGNSAYWVAGEQWNNGETIDLIVELTDTNMQVGVSSVKTVTLEYPPLETLELVVSLISLPGTNGTNAVRLEHSQSTYEVENFVRYEYWRTEIAEDGITEIPNTTIHLANQTDPSITELLDADVTSKQRYRWDVRQVVWVGNDQVASENTSVTSMCEWHGLILHLPYDPMNWSLGLPWSGAGGDYDPEVGIEQAMTFARPVGVKNRLAYFGTGMVVDPGGTYGLITDEYGTANEKLDKLIAMLEHQQAGADDRPHVVCWRDGRGGRIGRQYGVLSVEGVSWIEDGESYDVDLTLTETLYTIGVS